MEQALATIDVAIKQMAQSKIRINTDHVWERTRALGCTAPREPKVMGAAMNNAKRLGLIRPTDTYVPSRRPECHRRPIRVWESLVYDGRKL